MRFQVKNLSVAVKGVGICAILLLIGCERMESKPHVRPVANVQGNIECKIGQAMKKVPEWLNCCHIWEARWLVTSNISENVRKIADPAIRRRYVSSYTNLVFNLDFPVDAALEDKLASRNVWINLNAYYELIECGFSMMCEMEAMNPEMWNFLLESPIRYKKALVMRRRRLESAGVPATRFRADALFNELSDGLQNCSRIIESGWYPSARRRMSPVQRAVVRQKVKDALGELPPEMAKDDESAALPRVLMKQ